MKKSKIVSLVLISAALASCNKEQKGASGDWDEKTDKKVYMRSDTTARYSRTHHHGVGNALLWYYAFRPYGTSGAYSSGYSGGYTRTGFYSRGLSRSSNIGSNATKSTISRGGFGGRAFSRSSSS
ncbi:MAG: hypothetical protein JNL70_07710 [Saprospiraceae bacterium]|nr:hypothetical protein [Saprospiraceae bacterium]